MARKYDIKEEVKTKLIERLTIIAINNGLEGSLHDHPGGLLSDYPGDPLSSHPGGPLSSSPGDPLSDSPGDPLYEGYGSSFDGISVFLHRYPENAKRGLAVTLAVEAAMKRIKEQNPSIAPADRAEKPKRREFGAR